MIVNMDIDDEAIRLFVGEGNPEVLWHCQDAGTLLYWRKRALAMMKIEPTMNAVIVQLVDGRPVVSLMLKDESERRELEKLARGLLRHLRPETVTA